MKKKIVYFDILIKVDVTVYHRGFHGDLNETLFIGEVDEKSKLLTKVTYEALMKAIEIGEPIISKINFSESLKDNLSFLCFS